MNGLLINRKGLMLGALTGVIASALIGEVQRRRMNQLLKEIEDI